jgi:hypothetical protein
MKMIDSDGGNDYNNNNNNNNNNTIITINVSGVLFFERNTCFYLKIIKNAVPCAEVLF